jgi:DNA-binding NarL/FixJ family response regulator
MTRIKPGVTAHRRHKKTLKLAKGFTQTEIATQLGLSRHTVIDYVKSLYRKLDVSSRAEATCAVSGLSASTLPLTLRHEL